MRLPKPMTMTCGLDASAPPAQAGVRVQREPLMKRCMNCTPFPPMQLKALRKELAEAEAGLARAERLLRIADPDGWLKPGTKAAAVGMVWRWCGPRCVLLRGRWRQGRGVGKSIGAGSSQAPLQRRWVGGGGKGSQPLWF